MTTELNQVSVFLSYAHKDAVWLKKLVTHLSVLQRQGVISTWYDRQIVAGTNWARVIDQRLEQASIILLLVSADFLASDYCYEVEMKRALERHEAGQARVIPIAVRPADWKGAPFAHVQALPTGARAITTWKDKDEALVDVVTGLRRAIEDLSFAPASVVRARLPPLWNIPYPRNFFFLGRDEVLEKLHTQLHTGQATALSQSPYALSGLGGIGKTQVATEYAYRYHQDYEAVLWARAENQDALISSYAQLATLLKVPERDERKQEVLIAAVKAWLQTHQKWLLILDNADNLDIVPPFLPPVPGGHVLITTRAWDMQRLATRLEVETLPDEQGAMLLLQRAGLLTPGTAISSEDRQCATQITHELGGLPLALDQAGAYMEATGTSLKEYQGIYHTHRHTLLHERRSHIPDHPEAVATTWSLSFARIKEKNPAAADLLRLCAYCAPDAIPEEILTADAFRRNQAIEALRAYSLIRRNSSEKTLSVHRLVQAVLQDAMPAEEKQIWIERAVLAVNAAFPLPEFAHWHQCERCMPHALVCADLVERKKLMNPEAAHLLNNMGLYLYYHGRYTVAESLLSRAVKIYEQQEGEELRLAGSLNNLAVCNDVQKKYEQAKEFHQRALEIRQQVVGSMHPDTANSLNNLAGLYRTLGKLTQAQRLFKQALKIRQQVLGSTDLDTVSTMSNLAVLYQQQGRFEQAKELFEQALEIRQQVLGSMHPDTARAMSNLAVLYQQQGRFEQAKELFEQALEIRQQVLGSIHPDTAKSFWWLAELQQDQKLYQQAYDIFAQTLGPMDPTTLSVRQSLENNDFG